MKREMMKNKKKMLVLAMIAGISLSACSPAQVPDDQRVISEEEKSKAVDAADMSLPTVAPTAISTPVLGEGLVPDVPVEEVPIIDNGVSIILPGSVSVTVKPHEVISFYISELEADKKYDAVVFYSGNGRNDKTIKVGSFTANSTGEITDKVTLPANIAPGEYMLALQNDDLLYSTPITVAE